ncbi:hypothetical protein B0T10DRAFT_226494 [Thelonectria olida]|uniref:Uncharacterized protein n=1 Tax=Thelonectria olida TaxID=1576542 RepID=A0A9P9AUK6_9HYPO|nr:hypothetical protein B0T10DRAFT_226494 [Thelonectria olida]
MRFVGWLCVNTASNSIVVTKTAIIVFLHCALGPVSQLTIILAAHPMIIMYSKLRTIFAPTFAFSSVCGLPGVWSLAPPVPTCSR